MYACFSKKLYQFMYLLPLNEPDSNSYYEFLKKKLLQADRGCVTHCYFNFHFLLVSLSIYSYNSVGIPYSVDCLFILFSFMFIVFVFSPSGQLVSFFRLKLSHPPFYTYFSNICRIFLHMLT